MPRARAALAALALALGAVGGCSGARPVAALDGTAAAYRVGEPAFVLDAVARLADGEPGLDVALGLPPASVAFRPTADTLRALAFWTVTVEREGDAPLSRTAVDTLFAPDGAAARSPVPRWRAERFDLAPGAYTVRAVLEDRISDRTAARRVRVVVPGPADGPALSGLRLEALGPDGAAAPVDASAVPARLDSLRAVVQALGAPGAVAELTAVRLRADTAAAGPVVDPTPRPETLAARGVNTGTVDSVLTLRQVVEGEAVDLALPLPALEPGVYRVEVRLAGPDGRALDAAERLVVVRRRDYPLVARLGDLIGPLVYLAGPAEVAAIHAQRTPTARRREVDRFWGQGLADRRVAAATLRAYYERVEEANRLFATYKEGWKTDRGMAYVLFGPPRFVETTAEGERWAYGGGTLPVVLDFELTAGARVDGAPFEVYTLRRSRTYEEAWRTARRQWRAGIVP